MATGTSVVELLDVTVRYGRRAVLDRVTLALAGGEIVLVRGANGSGKTTLLRMLAGVGRPREGRRQGPPRCAYVPAALTPPTLAAGLWLDGVPRARPTDRRAALDRLGFDGDLGAGCRTLSFGNLRKLILAEALSSGESLVLIDEASAGLDDRGLSGLSALLSDLRAGGVAVALADQDSRPFTTADRVLRVGRGGLRVESPGEAVAGATPPRPTRSVDGGTNHRRWSPGPATVDGSRPEGEMTVALRGPAACRDDLLARAAHLGFRPIRHGPTSDGDVGGDIDGTDPGASVGPGAGAGADAGGGADKPVLPGRDGGER